MASAVTRQGLIHVEWRTPGWWPHEVNEGPWLVASWEKGIPCLEAWNLVPNVSFSLTCLFFIFLPKTQWDCTVILLFLPVFILLFLKQLSAWKILGISVSSPSGWRRRRSPWVFPAPPVSAWEDTCFSREAVNTLSSWSPFFWSLSFTLVCWALISTADRRCQSLSLFPSICQLLLFV